MHPTQYNKKEYYIALRMAENSDNLYHLLLRTYKVIIYSGNTKILIKYKLKTVIICEVWFFILFLVLFYF
jgi:hypothetical protein